MIRKIISIKNMGRFKNSAAAGNPDLTRHTLIVGANGSGKTTLCAMLRSLKSGDPAHITGRKTLGVEGPPTVELLLPTGPARFNGEGSVRLNLQDVKMPMAGILRPSVHTTRPGRLRGSA